ncbi:MAG TPA: flagellar biosynthesis protein FlgD [Clostridium sp.]|nr:flagellar biosynthesis protein FlgD [Clostridium sp.]
MAVNGVTHQKTIQDIINASENKANERNTDGLGKDDFLKLLITQLTHQDPMNPVDDKEFIAQMAQFSTLEQMQNMNSDFSQIKAFSMIGKTVTASIINKGTNAQEVIQGIVDSVTIENGKSILNVNGKDVPVDSVISVEGERIIHNDEDISKYTGLIGHKVEGIVYDSSTADMIGVAGVLKEIQRGIYENYGVLDGVSVNVAAINTEFVSADPEFRTNYLTSNLGEKVNLIISDGNGGEVPVTGVLNNFHVEDSGRITAVLDRVQISVDSIYKIKENLDSINDEAAGEGGEME